MGIEEGIRVGGGVTSANGENSHHTRRKLSTPQKPARTGGKRSFFRNELGGGKCNWGYSPDITGQ